MRNKSKRVLAVMMAMLVATSGVAATATTAFASTAAAPTTSSNYVNSTEGTGNYQGAKLNLSNAIVEVGEVVWDGTAQEPQLNVYIQGDDGVLYRLVKGTDYSVTNVTAKDAGAATATIVGAGDKVEGTTSFNYTIKQAQLSDVIEATAANAEYNNGDAVEGVTVAAKNGALGNGVTFEKDVDYKITYTNATNVTTLNSNPAKATITSLNPNVTGTVEATFHVTALELTAQDLDIDVSSCVWNGSVQVPALTITRTYTDAAGEKKTVTLKAGTDYTVANTSATAAKDDPSYMKDGASVGKHQATITFKGNYSGSEEVDFYIGANLQSVATVALKDNRKSYEYKEGGVTLEASDIVVKSQNGTTLTPDVDYVVKYQNNKAVGTATLIIQGKGSYGGQISTTFQIVPMKLTAAQLTATAGEAYYNFGNAVTPKWTVTYGDAGIAIPEENLSVSYTNNVNAGTAKATIKLSGNYELTGDALEKEFTISPITLANEDSVAANAVRIKDFKTLAIKANYTGKEFSIPGSAVTFEVNKGTDKKPNWVTVPSSAYEIAKDKAGAKFTDAGTQDGYVIPLDETNYTVAEAGLALTKKVTVNPAKWSDVKITFADGIVDNSDADSVTEAVKVTYGENILEAGATGKDYKVEVNNSYNADKDPIKAGYKRVVVTATSKNFTYTTAEAVTYKDLQVKTDIKDAVASVQIDLINGAYTYTGEEIKPAVVVTAKQGYTLTAGKDYEVVYTDNVNVTGQTKATITVRGIGAYAGIAGEVAEFDIAPKTIAGAKVEIADQTEDDTALIGNEKEQKADIVVKDGNKVLEQGVDYTVSIEEDAANGKYIVTITGAGNYDDDTTVKAEYIIKENLANESKFKLVAPATVPTAKLQNGEVVLTNDIIGQYKIQNPNGTLTLAYGKDYTVTAGAVDAATKTATLTFTGIGSYTGKLTATVNVEVESLGQVTSLKAVSKTTTTLKLRWAAVAGADGYEIYDAATDKLITTASTQNGVAELRKTVTGLNVGETRQYKVRAYANVNGAKVYGEFSETYTKATAVLEQVTGLKAIKKTTTTLKLTFNKVEGASYYIIYDAANGKELCKVSTQNGADKLIKTVTGLKAGVTRKYKVRAFTTVDGKTEYGAFSAVYTKATAVK